MAKNKKGGLKAALISQQGRLKKRQEAAQAAKATAQKSQVRSKGKEKARDVGITIPFKPTDNILLVGEGNFSFAKALVIDPPASLQYLPPGNVYATAYDSEEECFSKYPDAKDVVDQLRERGVVVLFGVDATNLERCVSLRNQKFDRIVWNFPHAGKGITDQDRNILSNQVLLLGFFASCSNFLSVGPIPSVHQKRRKKTSDDDEENVSSEESGESASPRGTVLITLRNVPPYTLWEVPKLAKNPPPPKSLNHTANPKYIQLRSFSFHRSIWKGYEHRMTKGERAQGQGTTGIGGEDRTWEFCLKD